MSPGILSFVSALIGMIAGGFVLKETPATAVQQIPVQWYPKLHNLVRAAGVDRVMCLLGCLGLGLEFLCLGCAAAVPTLLGRTRFPVLDPARFGLAIFLGCGLSGLLLGWTCSTLVTFGLGGFCVFGFIFSLVLLVVHGRQMVETPSRMLVLHGVTLMTMYLGVWSGQVVDITKPRLVLGNILLVPAMCMMGCLVARLILRAHSGYTLFSFVFLVPFTGLVFGLKTERHRGEEPPLSNTYCTIQAVVYSAELLTGTLGLLAGLRLSLWDLCRAGRLAFWISVPAAVTLCVLGGDVPHTHLLGVCVGGGGVLGLLSGLTAAAGVAVGLAIVPLVELCLYLFAVLNHGTVDDVIILLHRCRGGGYNCVFVNTGVDFAVLSVVMMGSTVLGGATFLTAGLGSSGHHGMVMASIITILKAVYLLCDLNM